MIFTPGKIEVSPSEAGYDESRLDVLNRHFQSIIDGGKIQCAMYCLTRHGKVFAHGAVGKKSYRADDDTPARPDDIRWYASITKVITATAIMKMVEDGLLRLNSPVGEILPQFDTPPFNSINIMHLLTHTSGLHADGGCYDNKYQSNYWGNIDTALKLRKEKDGEFDWLSAALKTIGSGMRKNPGEEWSYCSFGYMVLGAVIEKLSGVHSHEYIMEKIAKPLGMNDTFFDLTPELAKRTIATNEKAEKHLQEIIGGTHEPSEWDKLNLPFTSGGMNGTARDLARFGNMFLANGLAADGTRVLGRKAVEKMFQKQVELPNYCWNAGGAMREYATGFDMRTDFLTLTTPTTISHEGAGACSLYIDPQEEMVAAWIVPFSAEGWHQEALFNALNIMWSGLK